MAAAKKVTLVALVILSMSGLNYSFNPLFELFSDSITHRVITERAVLRKTAEVCRDIAASEGRDFNLTIDDSLTAGQVQRACVSTGSDSPLSTSSFKSSIKEMYLSNALVDVVSVLSAKHHFDDETFSDGRDIITSGKSAVKNSTRLGNYKAARWTLGQIFHTLQDFYSHSNWAELNKTAPYSALIRPDLPLKNLAGLNTPTCRNCDGDNCDDNILPEVMDQGLVTSGYFAIVFSEKPPGKCSHGGSVDRTSKRVPVGGINKDTTGSNHGSYHHRAADLAVNASMELLEDIRLAVGDKNFLRLMGVSQSSALCFIIDTSVSMEEDMEEVKRVSLEMTDSKRGTALEPCTYILVPFNDPSFGPVFQTTDADAFKNQINGLSASGGGDEPELSLSGLQLALTSAPPNSEMFLFTDAAAKDAGLKNTILALIENTGSVVNFMLTNVLQSRPRRRNFQGPSSHLSQSDAVLYSDLARASGGLAIEVSEADLSAATNVILDSTATAVVTVFQAERNPGRLDSFTFTADGSLRNMTVYITGDSSLTFTLTAPTGVSQTSSQSSGPLASLTTAGNLRRLSPSAENLTGSWELSVSSLKSYSVKVTGRSPVNVIVSTLEAHEGPHGAFSKKEGRPLTDGNVTLLVTVTGNDTAKVTEVTLFDSSRPTEVKGSPQSVGSGDYLVTFSGVPAGTYVVLLRGEDSSGSTPTTFQRQASTQIKTSSISVTTQATNTSIEPGSTISIPFTVATVTGGVVDNSSTETFTVRANNDRGFTSTFPSTVSANESSGGRANGIVTLTVPSDTATGTHVTLTIEAENAAATDINFAVITLSVTAEVTDVSRPVCQEVGTSGLCPSSSLCSSSQWTFIANLSDGISGTGIDSIRIHTGNGTLNTNMVTGAGGETITVVTYSATCCSQRVVLVAVDKVGNVRTCEGQALASSGGPALITSSCLWIWVGSLLWLVHG